MLLQKKKSSYFDERQRSGIYNILKKKVHTTVTPSKSISICTNYPVPVTEFQKKHNNECSNKQNIQINIADSHCRRSTLNIRKAAHLQESFLNKLSISPISKSQNDLMKQPQKLICKNHSTKEAAYEDQVHNQLYCERCAIALTSEGFRIKKIQEKTKFKKMLEKFLNQQIYRLENNYRTLINKLEDELKLMTNLLKDNYNLLLQDQWKKDKFEIISFKQNIINDDLFFKIRQMIGKFEIKEVKPILTDNLQLRLQQSNSTRIKHSQSRPKNTKTPNQIFIELSQIPNDNIKAKCRKPSKSKMLSHEIENILNS